MAGRGQEAEGRLIRGTETGRIELVLHSPPSTHLQAPGCEEGGSRESLRDRKAGRRRADEN